MALEVRAGRYFRAKLRDANVKVVDPSTAITNATTVGATFVQAEVNAIVTKVNAILAALREQEVINT